MCFKLKGPWLHQAGAPAAQQKRDQEGGKYLQIFISLTWIVQDFIELMIFISPPHLPHLPDPAATVAPANPVAAAPAAPVNPVIAATAPVRLFIAFWAI